MSRLSPKLPAAPSNWDQAWASRLVNTLELQISSIQSSASSDPYQMSNVTIDRELDADSTTLAEVADVLGTLITDLKEKGVIS